MREEFVTGEPAGFDGAAQEVLIEVITRRIVGGKKSHHDRVRAGSSLEFDVERAVFADPILVPIEQLDSLAVEQEFQFLAGDLAERVGVAHVAFADGSDLYGVLAIGGELMLHDHAAAGTEGHAFNVIVLRGILGDVIRRLGSGGYIADRKTADFTGSGGVPLQQGGRERQGTGDIVKAARRIVRRQILAGIDIDGQQIANGVLIFGAVQAVQTGRGQVGDGVLVKLVFEVNDGSFEGGGLGAGHTGGRHHPGTNFMHHPFPFLGVLLHMGDVEGVERDGETGWLPGLSRLFVVTDDTVLIQESALGDGGRSRRGGGIGDNGRGLRPANQWQASQAECCKESSCHVCSRLKFISTLAISVGRKRSNLQPMTGRWKPSESYWGSAGYVILRRAVQYGLQLQGYPAMSARC